MQIFTLNHNTQFKRDLLSFHLLQIKGKLNLKWRVKKTLPDSLNIGSDFFIIPLLFCIFYNKIVYSAAVVVLEFIANLIFEHFSSPTKTKNSRPKRRDEKSRF